MAAFANGAMTHSLDYDDVHDEGQTHPTSHALIAALAIAEKVGKINGKEFIAAIALSCDMVNRMGLAITESVEEHGWLSPSVLGYFSATAAAGKLLGLTVPQMASAFGSPPTRLQEVWRHVTILSQRYERYVMPSAGKGESSQPC